MNLRPANLDLPEEGWGWITLERAVPDTGRARTDSGLQRDERQLKHRAVGETCRVPCPPELVVMLRHHLEKYETGKVGRVSPLARRPYDLRHAAVSTWLNGGVPATQVTEWAGHSVAVLLEVYAK